MRKPQVITIENIEIMKFNFYEYFFLNNLFLKKKEKERRVEKLTGESEPGEEQKTRTKTK